MGDDGTLIDIQSFSDLGPTQKIRDKITKRAHADYQRKKACINAFHSDSGREIPTDKITTGLFWEMRDTLGGLLAHWETFTSEKLRGGWGNQQDAYYDLAKHAQQDWAAARALLAKLEDKGQ